MLSFYCQRPETLFPLPLSVLRTIFDIMFMAEDAAFAQHTLYWCWNRDFVKNLICISKHKMKSFLGVVPKQTVQGEAHETVVSWHVPKILWRWTATNLSNFLHDSQCSAPFGDFGYGGRFPGHPADFFPPGPGHMSFLGHPGQHGPPLPRWLTRVLQF